MCPNLLILASRFRAEQLLKVLGDIPLDENQPISTPKFVGLGLNMSKGGVKNGHWVGGRSEQYSYYMRDNLYFKDLRVSRHAMPQLPINRQKFEMILRSHRIHKFLNKE